MEENKGFMYRLAAFIVDRRKAFMVLFVIAIIYCLVRISDVSVEDDVTKYLPQDTETRQGVDIMDNEFETHGSAKILLANITYDQAFIVAKGLEEIDGVDTVKFYDPEDDDYKDDSLEDYYRDSAALITLTFDEEKDTELSQQAIKEIRDYVKEYDNYVFTTVDLDESAELKSDVSFILLIAVFVILGVLLFTSSTYAEVPIFMLTFITAAILNKGTNYIFGTVSFISNSVDVILQLALAIDYAIIMFHRYMEEHDKGLEPRDAVVAALSKAIIEISSSSLTTMAGMVALVFMQFKIGQDLGLVLCKAILFSMLSVFLFMPGLIMWFRNNIDKTRHKSFVPKITAWGKFIVRTRHVFPIIFIVIIVFAFRLSNSATYIFDKYTARGPKKTAYVEAKDRIDETFETGNNLAIVIPKGDYEKEAEIIKSLKSRDYVDDVLALANVEVGDNKEYVLTDSVNPRDFAEIADVDAGIAKLLYTVYAQDKESYGAFIDGIDEYRVSVLDLIDLIYDKKEAGTFNLSAKQSKDLDDIHEQIETARVQLESEDHSRIIFTLKGEVEGETTYREVDEIRKMVQSFYKDRIFVVGDPTAAADLSSSFNNDNLLISVLTAFFVGVILLFTFQSISLPFILLLTIQGSIWINFAIPNITDNPLYFLAYLIVSSIQMGATIDYAIVITNRYVTLRQETSDRRELVIRSLNESFATIVTSGTILTVCGFLVGNLTSNAVIANLGTALGRGTLLSIAMVMIILPQLLYIFDPIFDKSSFKVRTPELGGSLAGTALQRTAGTMVINGTVNGYFSGYLIGEFKGTMNGDINLTLRRGVADAEEEPKPGTEEEPKPEAEEAPNTEEAEAKPGLEEAVAPDGEQHANTDGRKTE
ncbi:MAG: MMPL family transporter [Lachnospiraceae bacterium]|nr:MMPL family transporter [Lachnospiraceae bacterium]